ncbi:Mediator complex, subunit Med7 [Corchorus capsularis]|uniref:Mediator of RNA polymerase II transcription subunit 7 n=1 Tax=Corchorus capsularis TaxID=210143 RepID=A0A1R3G1A4_COCAP|nr:Mediator complex, subunit Med7 [Corchorus capsularis]
MATATYPPPPPYYRLYKDYLQNPKSAPEPPPPIEGTYVCFGGNYTTDDVLPSLEDQGVRQLYPKGPNIDFKKELRSLNRELQLHILELADVLVERPSQYARRVEEISLIFKNLHHLLNSLRPHQARATLIHILELQIQRRKQALEDIKRQLGGALLFVFDFRSVLVLAYLVPCFFLIHFFPVKNANSRRREEAQRLLKDHLGP